jgi:hypothetical protein
MGLPRQSEPTFGEEAERRFFAVERCGEKPSPGHRNVVSRRSNVFLNDAATESIRGFPDSDFRIDMPRIGSECTTGVSFATAESFSSSQNVVPKISLRNWDEEKPDSQQKNEVGLLKKPVPSMRSSIIRQ